MHSDWSLEIHGQIKQALYLKVVEKGVSSFLVHQL